MARTLEQIVQEAMGAHMMSICSLQAQLEAAQAQIAKLTPPAEPPTSTEREG